jgi:hypothetical protein
MVRRTRFCVTLYVHLLSCFFQKGKQIQNNPSLICRLELNAKEWKLGYFLLFPYFKAKISEILTETNFAESAYNSSSSNVHFCNTKMPPKKQARHFMYSRLSEDKLQISVSFLHQWVTYSQQHMTSVTVVVDGGAISLMDVSSRVT